MLHAAKLSILGGVIAIAFLGEANACMFSTDCEAGSHCQKSLGELYGVCVGGIHPGNRYDQKPIHSPSYPKYGDTCRFNTDCGPGTECVKTGGIYGTCMRIRW